MTHTPSPWAYDGVRVYAPAFDAPFLVTPIDGEAFEQRGGLIALVYAPPGSGSSTVANATLITAAPELLACCRQVLAVIDRHPDAECEAATLDRLRAVVASIDGDPARTP